MRFCQKRCTMVRLLLLLLGAVTVTPDPVDVDLAQLDNDYADRIIGGVPATIEEFPFIVSVTSAFNDGHLRVEKLCGGTIITVDWVMTAAHCLTTDCSDCLNGVTVRAGSSNHDMGGVLRAGTSLIRTNNPQHDITLIKVNDPWPLNGKTISLGRLPQQGAPIPGGRPATIMGWGEIDMDGDVPEGLMKAQVQVLSAEDCLDMYSFTNITVSDMEICTFDSPRRKLAHSWLGDSGSPVVVDGQVVGIVSSGVASGELVLPDIHTRVSSYIEWIEQAVGPLP